MQITIWDIQYFIVHIDVGSWHISRVFEFATIILNSMIVAIWALQSTSELEIYLICVSG